jgi:hypothetical protein
MELPPAAMLSHLRALPELAISLRTVNGIGGAPGSLMWPYLAGSRTTSSSSGFWPYSQEASKTRTEKALITRVDFIAAAIVVCSEARFWHLSSRKIQRTASGIYFVTAARFPDGHAAAVKSFPPLSSRNVLTVEPGMVLSPSLHPRARPPAPPLGRSRAVLSLGQRGRRRSDRQVGRPK